MNRKTTLRLLSRSGFWLLVVIIALYTLFPFYWALNSSFKSRAGDHRPGDLRTV